MHDNVSREQKLAITKDIVCAMINGSKTKKGEEETLDLSTDDVCTMFKQVFTTIDEVAPKEEKRVGLGV